MYLTVAFVTMAESGTSDLSCGRQIAQRRETDGGRYLRLGCRNVKNTDSTISSATDCWINVAIDSARGRNDLDVRFRQLKRQC